MRSHQDTLYRTGGIGQFEAKSLHKGQIKIINKSACPSYVCYRGPTILLFKSIV